jgi:RNA-dependent RNA polymerase
MLLAGYDFREPYFRALVNRFLVSRYDGLNEKLSIVVEVSQILRLRAQRGRLMIVQKSARVFGVVDEYDVLEENEVYINLPQRSGPVVGKVVVAR